MPRRGAVLLVTADRHLAAQLRQCLTGIGYDSVSTSSTHAQALERMQERTFSLVLFDAVMTNVPVVEFVIAAKRFDGSSTLIAVSAQPRIDQVFEYLRVGARGFLVTPFTSHTLESVIGRATQGPPFSDAILDAADRDAALAALVLNGLYRLATAMRHVRDYSSHLINVPQYRRAFVESIELARTFSLGGDDGLREKIIEACIIRGQTAATRLGRTRRRLHLQRAIGQRGEDAQAAKRSGVRRT